MKRYLYSIIILSGFACSTAVAQTFADVFNESTEIIWLGIDFSVLKLVGDEGSWEGKKPANMFKAWNDLMISEKDKYDVAKTLHHDQVKFALDVTMDHNASLPETGLFLNDASERVFKKVNVAEVVKSYDFKGNTGIGFMIVAETFDKKKMNAVFWVTFINMNTNEILYAQRMSERPDGIGLRNHWARPVYNILMRIKLMEYRAWRKAEKKTDS